jgi:hypothetical protein
MIDRLLHRFWFRVSFWLPRRLMYFAINRAIIEGRQVYGDKWLFTLHKLGNVRSEYGGLGRFGRKRQSDINYPVRSQQK